MVVKTHEIEKQVDSLIHEAKVIQICMRKVMTLVTTLFLTKTELSNSECYGNYCCLTFIYCRILILELVTSSMIS